MAIGALGLGIGLASAGIGAISSFATQRKAERAMSRMGKRPGITVPKEIMDAYTNRKKRSKMYQGFTPAELEQMKRTQARQSATFYERAKSLNSSSQALQAMAGSRAMDNSSDIAARSAMMNRQGQNIDLSAADSLAGSIGGFRNQNELSVLGNYDNTMQTLGGAVSNEKSYRSSLISGIGNIGSAIATDPSMWGYSPSNVSTIGKLGASIA
jgi:hypothetical protein